MRPQPSNSLQYSPASTGNTVHAHHNLLTLIIVKSKREKRILCWSQKNLVWCCSSWLGREWDWALEPPRWENLTPKGAHVIFGISSTLPSSTYLRTDSFLHFFSCPIFILPHYFVVPHCFVSSKWYDIFRKHTRVLIHHSFNTKRNVILSRVIITYFGRDDWARCEETRQ